MKLMILDGNSVINRAFYGVRPLTTRDGLYTNAIYGFLNILEKERSEEKPDALCVAFDLHAPTFRHLRYDGYKATRHPMPEELAMQMPVMKQVLAAMNIPVYACEGWEADDVLGTVGRLCEEAGWDCAILTGDRDSLQLVDEHVSVRLVHTQGGQTRTEHYTPDVFRAEYGLEPKRLIDLKALMGDSSDNIPGVAGVGPKTANDLLQRFGTLDGVYANLSRENMKGKLFDKLENGRESAYLSYELATIRCDAPIDFTPENNLIRPPKRRALYDLFTTLEFQRLIDRYGLRSAALEQDESEEPALPVTGSCTLLDVQTPEQAQPLLSGVTLSIAAADDLSMLVAAPHMDGPDQTAYVLRRETLGTDFVPLLQRLFAAGAAGSRRGACGDRVRHGRGGLSARCDARGIRPAAAGAGLSAHPACGRGLAPAGKRPCHPDGLHRWPDGGARQAPARAGHAAAVREHRAAAVPGAGADGARRHPRRRAGPA